MSTATAEVRVPAFTATSSVQRRRALRHLASPVAVLTVNHDGRLHGTTVSTVTGVSHSPLLLGACLKSGSVFASLAVAAGRFTVNVLDSGQSSVAGWFANRKRPDGAAQFDGLDWRPDPYTGAPLLDGALAQYACRVSGCVAVGDHEVLLGQVTHATTDDGAPLLSFAGGLFAGTLRPVPIGESGPARPRKENAQL